METVVIIALIVLIGVAAFVWNKLQTDRRNEIVECGSCQNRMTRAAFSQRGGCPRCGSDIFTRTGQRADRDNRI